MIFTAIATAIASALEITSTTFIGITAAVLQVASGLAVSWVAKSISGANSAGASQFAVSGTLQAGGDIERSFIVGLGGTSGSLVYANEWGNDGSTPNAYHTQVICLSDLPVAGPGATGLAGLYVGGTGDTIMWGETEQPQGFPVLGYRDSNGVDHLWVKFYDGTQTAADPFLVSTFANATPVTSAVTISIGSPAVISRAAHGLRVNTPITFATTGVLPTGIVAGTTYYVSAAGLLTDSFEISATPGGSSISTSGTQSGSHSANTPGRAYSASRIGTGCAYVIMTALVNDGLFSGFPSYMFSLNGSKLYDISKDSTAGGSGTHRWADKTTWGGDGDQLPAVQAYNVLRGVTYNGTWLYGLQTLTAQRLPAANWIAAINACRATVAIPGGTEATYRSGGEVGVNATIADTLTTLLTTCQGRISEVGGSYTIKVGAPGSADFSFDDSTILSTEAQTFTPFYGLADTINGITAKYPEPASAWNYSVPPPLYNPADEILDGNRRLLADVSFDFVPYDGQVQRLMLSALNEARRARRHTIVLPPQYWTAMPGDILSWTSVRNGYTAKLFRVDGCVDAANLDITVDITEVDPSDYAFDYTVDYTAVQPAPIVVGRPSPQPVTSPSVAPYSLLDATSVARRPTIEVFWNGAQPDVIAVLWEVRVTATGALWASGQIDDVAAGSGILPPVYGANIAYQVRIKYLPGSNRDTVWTDWMDVVTPDVKLSTNDIVVVFDALSTAMQSIQSFVVAAANDARTALENISNTVQDQDFANFADKQELLTQITSTSGSIIADYTSKINVATAANAALSTLVSSLTATVSSNTAAITTEQTARSGADAALGTRIDAVTATADGNTAAISSEASTRAAADSAASTLIAGLTSSVGANTSGLATETTARTSADSALATQTSTLFSALGGNSASVNVAISAGATQAGYSARYVLQCAVNDGLLRGATLFLDVPADHTQPTRVGVQAGQFAFFADDGTPIVAINGSGILASANGAVQINLLTGDFKFG